MNRATDKTKVLIAIFASVFTVGLPRDRIQGRGEQSVSG